jgi:hypothetical protein
MHPLARALWLQGCDCSFEFSDTAEAQAAIKAALEAHPDLAEQVKHAPAWGLQLQGAE